MRRGGFICQTYGSSMGGLVDAVQMEVPSEIRWHVSRTYGCWTLKPLALVPTPSHWPLVQIQLTTIPPLPTPAREEVNAITNHLWLLTWASHGGPLLSHIHAQTTLASSGGRRGGRGRLMGRGKHRPKSDLTRISCPIRRTFHPVKVWADSACRIWTWIFLLPY
jgi:hypothetical protein